MAHQFHPWIHIRKKNPTNSKEYMHSNVIAALFILAKI